METDKITKSQLNASIKGMHCAACSSRIEKVVGSSPGVEIAQVNLAAETIRLEFDQDTISLEKIQDTIAGLGFELILPSETEHLSLDIGGMHCAACSSRIEKVVGSLEGVESAQVNLATETAVVEYDPKNISARIIKEAISNLGFTALNKDQQNVLGQKQEEAQARLLEMKKRLMPAFVFAFVLLTVSMGEMVGLPLPSVVSPHASPLNFALLQLFLVLPIMWSGRNFYINGFPALFRGSPNMDSLIAVGTGAAFSYSLWNLVEIGLGINVMARVMDLYFESAGVLIALVSLGKYLETRSKAKTSDAIRQLMQLVPDQATLIKDGTQTSILVEEIEAGDLLLIKPGDRVPVDGTVVKGSSAVDESMLTGESIPVTKTSGDQVVGATLNKNGVLEIKAEKVGKDTVLARIIQMVQDAQGSKAPIANLADTISLYFVPTVMVIALLSGLSWYLFGGVEFSFALRIFVAVMVIACPCAMGLATPTSIMVGTGRGAQLGVLVKSGGALEMAKSVQAIIFDKTGTLTYGKPALTDFVMVQENGISKERLFQLVASAENVSEHPLAEAIVQKAQEEKVVLLSTESFKAIPGRGIEAIVEGEALLFGNIDLIKENKLKGLDVKVTSLTDEISSNGCTALYLAVNGCLEAVIGIADQIKQETPATIKRLKQMGLQVIMLTGDHLSTATAIAKQAGIDEVIAQVMPEEKAAKVQEVQEKGLRVAMVGDGINDAPAMALADVGIAMGTGIDIAIESGDIVLMKGDLGGVVTALQLSRATLTNIKQNLFWAFAYNVVGIPVAAGLLFIFGGPTLNPMIAGGAMALSSVSVVSNALRLRFFTPKP